MKETERQQNTVVRLSKILLTSSCRLGNLLNQKVVFYRRTETNTSLPQGRGRKTDDRQMIQSTWKYRCSVNVDSNVDSTFISTPSLKQGMRFEIIRY
jgi:hypothetical protein